jgi:UDP-N-acetyl-D-glucosamine/UDP-N-acetyl-D-galactosamine dehydrogenase
MNGSKDPRSRRIAVLGLGYVGLPVATAFARRDFDVIGYDIDPLRVRELHEGFDRTGEVDAADLRLPRLSVTNDPAELTGADFYIVTLPTPIDASRRPDLSALIQASETIGRHLNRGDIVVYESTVYPGATEEDCAPVLERSSGLICGRDFFLGYSPERINPGDALHRFETVRKVVAGQDAETLQTIASVYGAVVSAGLHLAPSIRVAEAAKVIENSQRDLNIAFMNELSSIFHLIGIDTADVLAAAATKWNFLAFTPGLVGGHCIGVDPYYLTHRAEREGYHPQVILAGRRINDAVGERVAQECVRLLLARGAPSRRVAILGVTFKENVPDIRNSRVFDIVRELERFGIKTEIADPVASPQDVRNEHGVELSAVDRLGPADAVILAVPHRAIVAGGWPMIEKLLAGGNGIVLDVKGALDRARQPDGVLLWRM